METNEVNWLFCFIFSIYLYRSNRWFLPCSIKQARTRFLLFVSHGLKRYFIFSSLKFVGNVSIRKRKKTSVQHLAFVYSWIWLGRVYSVVYHYCVGRVSAINRVFELSNVVELRCVEWTYGISRVFDESSAVDPNSIGRIYAMNRMFELSSVVKLHVKQRSGISTCRFERTYGIFRLI